MFTNVAIYIDPSVNSQPMLDCILPIALLTKASVTLLAVVKPLPPLARKEKSIDLLIIGTVCRTGIAGLFIGNTAEKVLTEVSCSVLAFKPKAFITPVTLVEE